MSITGSARPCCLEAIAMAARELMRCLGAGDIGCALCILLCAHAASKPFLVKPSCFAIHWGPWHKPTCSSTPSTSTSDESRGLEGGTERGFCQHVTNHALQRSFTLVEFNMCVCVCACVCVCVREWGFVWEWGCVYGEEGTPRKQQTHMHTWMQKRGGVSYLEPLRHSLDDTYRELCDFRGPQLGLLAVPVVVALCLHHHLAQEHTRDAWRFTCCMVFQKMGK